MLLENYTYNFNEANFRSAYTTVVSCRSLRATVVHYRIFPTTVLNNRCVGNFPKPTQPTPTSLFIHHLFDSSIKTPKVQKKNSTIFVSNHWRRSVTKLLHTFDVEKQVMHLFLSISNSSFNPFRFVDFASLF